MYEVQRERACILRAALCVYRLLGPHMSESIYQNALIAELGGSCAKEVVANVMYKNKYVGYHRYDIVFGSAIIEVKIAKGRSIAAFKAQIAKYNAHKSASQHVVLVAFCPTGVIVR